MVFQMDVEYPEIDKLAKTAMDYFTSPKMIDNQKPILRVKTEDLDPFWINLVKRYNLGNSISNVKFHAMWPGSESEDPHQHQKARAVFYIQVPEGVGNLTLPDMDIVIKPHKGLFVVVPAEERHGITKNNSDEIRIVLAFYIE